MFSLSCYCKFLSLSLYPLLDTPIVLYFWHRVEILPDVLQPAQKGERNETKRRKKKTISNTRFDPLQGFPTTGGPAVVSVQP